jgi:two-component system response regulator MtrA
MELVQIVLVEDDERLGEQLVPALEEAGYDARWARDVREGLRAIRDERPALVLLDLNLPDRSGFELLEELRERDSVPVIVLTARLLGEDKVRALDLGADDYVTKPFWNDELLARIRAILRRRDRVVQPDRVVVFGTVRVDLEARQVRVAGSPASLTPTEYELLRYFVQREGQALRRERLIDMVLLDDEASETTLRAHISRLRSKLGEDGNRIRTVWGIGYRFDAE